MDKPNSKEPAKEVEKNSATNSNSNTASGSNNNNNGGQSQKESFFDKLINFFSRPKQEVEEQPKNLIPPYSFFLENPDADKPKATIKVMVSGIDDEKVGFAEKLFGKKSTDLYENNVAYLKMSEQKFAILISIKPDSRTYYNHSIYKYVETVFLRLDG